MHHPLGVVCAVSLFVGVVVLVCLCDIKENTTCVCTKQK